MQNIFDNPSQSESLAKIFARFLPGTFALYLFGSQASGEANSRSDVDLAFLRVQKPSGDIFFKVKTEISFLLKKDVDLVDLLRADMVTASQVVYTGKVLFCTDLRALHDFETATYSRYCALNEERREILESINKKGMIHG